MKKILSAFLTAAMVFSMISEPVMAAGKATPSGISYEDIGAQIETLADENEGNYASFATAVFDGDEVLYSNHFGYIDRENQIVADDNAVYEWGSISKMFIWVSVMQLYEQGKIDLNADIQTYLPEGFLTKLKYDETITMMNLLNHNAGWQETTKVIEVSVEEDLISLEEALKKTEPVQVFKPGETTAYSNWGAALAGYIVERVSGMDYTEYLHQNVLEPLGMEQTSVSADYRDNEWVRAQRDKSKAYLILNYPGMGKVMDKDLGTSMSYILIYPAGSVTGTLADITKFAQAFVDEECPLFHKQETLELMLTASAFYGDSDIPRNCHGLWVTEYAVSTIGHGGNTRAGSANLVFNKDTKVGVVVLTNQQSEMVFCQQIPRLVFGSFMENPLYTNGTITKRNSIVGCYGMSRNVFKGAGKISACLNFLPLTKGKNSDSFTQLGVPAVSRFADNLYILDGADAFLYETTDSEGRIILEYSVMDFMQRNVIIGELMAIVLFGVLVLVSLVTLIVKGIMKLVKKYKAIPAGKAILAGQLSKLVSGVAFVIILLAYGKSGFEIACVFMGLCAIVCAVVALFTAKALVTEKEMKKFARVRYVFSVLCNIFVLGFVIYFQLFAFWV